MPHHHPTINKESPMQLHDFIKALQHALTPYQALYSIFTGIEQKFSCNASLLEYNDTGTLQKILLIEHDFSQFYKIITKKIMPYLQEDTPYICSFQHQKEQICLLTLPLYPKKGYILILKRNHPYGKKEKKLLTSIGELISSPLHTHIFYQNIFKEIGKYPTTSFLTWAFMAQTMDIYFTKLDAHKLASSFMVICVKEISEIALKYGALKEEETLLYLANYFHKTFEPTDLIARIGQNIFAVWLNGQDRFSSAEHANKITQNPLLLPFLNNLPLHFKIGLACREDHSPDNAENLREQAMIALYTLHKEEGKKWYFAHQHA